MLAQKGIVYSDVSGSCGGVTACRSGAGGYVRGKIYHSPSFLQLSGSLRSFLYLINGIYKSRQSTIAASFSPSVLSLLHVREFFPSLLFSAYDYFRLYNIYQLYCGGSVRTSTPVVGIAYLVSTVVSSLSLSLSLFNFFFNSTAPVSFTAAVFVRPIASSAHCSASSSYVFLCSIFNTTPLSVNLFSYLPGSVLAKLQIGGSVQVKIVFFPYGYGYYPLKYVYVVPVVS